MRNVRKRDFHDAFPSVRVFRLAFEKHFHFGDPTEGRSEFLLVVLAFGGGVYAGKGEWVEIEILHKIPFRTGNERSGFAVNPVPKVGEQREIRFRYRGNLRDGGKRVAGRKDDGRPDSGEPHPPVEIVVEQFLVQRERFSRNGIESDSNGRMEEDVELATGIFHRNSKRRKYPFPKESDVGTAEMAGIVVHLV